MATDAGTRAVKSGHRMSLSEILQLLLTKGTPERSSVTLSRNAKGETQIEVTVRTGDSAGIETVEQAEQAARESYDRLRAEYPLPDANGGGSVTFSRNAKGETQIEVVARTSDLPGESADLDNAYTTARRLFDNARVKFPMSDGYAGAAREPVSAPDAANGDAEA